jgi:hypothetical protein
MDVTLRRLDPDRDESLVREAVSWLDEQPLFWRNCDSAWGTESADAYLRQMGEGRQADFGLFIGGEFRAVITLSLEGQGLYNTHLMAKRGTDPAALVLAVASMRSQVFRQGAAEVWNWVAAKNRGVRRILEAAGMVKDGVERFKGASHGRPILWVRYSARAV